MPILIAMQGAEQLRRVAKACRDAGRGDVLRDARREIRKAAVPVMADVRAAALAAHVESAGGGARRPDSSTQLRARIAAAVKISVTARRIRIKIDGRKVGIDGAQLAKYLDANLKRYQRWRHPVFARGEDPSQWTWVEQRGSGYFFTTILKHEKDFRRACLSAMDQAMERIRRA